MAVIEEVEQSEGRFYTAELYRLKGELLLRQAMTNAPQAEASFRQALDLARRAQAKWWELRAAMSLSRLWQRQGKCHTAHRHPAPELGFFFWNATGACCGFESVYGPQVDDAGFLLRLVDAMIAQYPVDPQRVYVFGFSNGGDMAHRMACDHADRFAAVVSLAGATFKDPERCAPSTSISVLQVHSKDDDVVLFDGGFAPEVPPSPETEYPGAIETIEQWGHVNGCKGALRFGKRPVLDLATLVEGKETTINRITRCPHGVDVELWSIEGIPHVPLSFVVGPHGITTLAEKTWKFLRQHERDEEE